VKVYVSGPMRGRPAFNFPSFDIAQAKLAAMGHEVFSPAKRDRDLHPEIDWYSLSGDMDELDHEFDLREALAADCKWICEEAEAVCTLDGWEGSSGANAEVALAKALGLPVYTLDQFEAVWSPKCWVPAEGMGPVAPQYRAVQQVVPDQSAEFNRRHPEGEVLLPFSGGFITTKAPEEVRETSESGAMKGVKLARYDLIPVKALKAVAEHYGRTAKKYPPNNWRKGFEWSKSYSALVRHLTQWWDGEDLDVDPSWPEGSPHLAAVAWHALTLLEYALTGTGVDDRP
jgi:hypothetical protein